MHHVRITNFSETWIKIKTVPTQKIFESMSFANWWLFRPGFDVFRPPGFSHWLVTRKINSAMKVKCHTTVVWVTFYILRFLGGDMGRNDHRGITMVEYEVMNVLLENVDVCDHPVCNICLRSSCNFPKYLCQFGVNLYLVLRNLVNFEVDCLVACYCYWNLHLFYVWRYCFLSYSNDKHTYSFKNK